MLSGWPLFFRIQHRQKENNMQQVTFPFEQFLDTSGNPLDNGYVYVGTANQNPETNPIAIYWDAALTIPAAQPIRTINGYLSNSGTPARLYTSPSIFSITVRDKTQAIVASALDASTLDNLRADLAASSGASLVWYLPAGTGAVAAAVQAKLRESVSVKDFGAVGDGVADDTAEVQSAINSGAKRLVWPSGTYSINATGIDGVSNQVWESDGNGATIIKLTEDTAAEFIEFTGKSLFAIHDITIDYNGKTATGNVSALNCTSCTDFEITGCRVIGIDKFGISLNGVQRFKVKDNYIAKTTAANIQNQAILVSSSASASLLGEIVRNTCIRSAIDVDISESKIELNTVEDWKFGGGITTEQSANCHTLQINHNILSGGTGTDINVTNCPGIENWAARSAIIGNLIFNNSGSGIDQGGHRNVVLGNVVWNNGVVGGSGITARYGDAAYNSSESVYVGNRCFDTLGAGGTQTDGYTEESTSLANIMIESNLFKGNKTAPQNILSTTTSFVGPSVSATATYDPPSLNDGIKVTTDVTCPGARLGDLVSVSFSVDLQGIILHAWVNASNNVKVRFQNATGGTLDLASGTLVVQCMKHRNSVEF